MDEREGTADEREGHNSRGVALVRGGCTCGGGLMLCLDEDRLREGLASKTSCHELLVRRGTTTRGRGKKG